MRRPVMMRALLAGSAYFAVLFALGFVMGVFRVTLVAPSIGALAATMVEVPIMLAAAYFLCIWAIRRWQIPPEFGIRWAMVLWFLALLFTCEALLGTVFFGLTLDDQWAAVAKPAGMVGLLAQIIAASLPLLVGRGDSD